MVRRTLIVRGGTVVDGSGRPATPADVVVDNGRVVALTRPGTADTTGCEIIDGDGLHVVPGFVDPHVHFDEPGRTEWEGFATGSAAAASGGVTTVVDMPIDSHPPTLTAKDVRAKIDAAKRSCVVDVALWGGLVTDSVASLDELAAAGVIGFKAFACPSGWDEFPAVDEPTLDAGLQAAAAFGIPVALHCEFEHLGHTERSEVAAVEWAANRAAALRSHLHVVHASSAAAVRAAKARPGVTVETCPHYLVLDADDARTIGPDALCAPPIRDAANRDELWSLLRDGTIDCIASDHSPCPPELKDGERPWAGVSGVETVFRALWTAAEEYATPIELLVERCTAAARLLGLSTKGRIQPGFDADLVLVDLDAVTTLQRRTLRCRHQRSPFVGRELRGAVRQTLVRGDCVFDADRGVTTPRRAIVLGPSGRRLA